MTTQHKQTGFSLMELALVVAIAAILSVVAIATYDKLEDSANLAAELSVTAAITAGLNAYYAGNDQTYPAQLDDAAHNVMGADSSLFDKVLVATTDTLKKWKKTGDTAYLNTATNHPFCYDATEGTFTQGECAANGGGAEDSPFAETGELIITNQPYTVLDGSTAYAYQMFIGGDFGFDANPLSLTLTRSAVSDGSQGTITAQYDPTTQQFSVTYNNASLGLTHTDTVTLPATANSIEIRNNETETIFMTGTGTDVTIPLDTSYETQSSLTFDPLTDETPYTVYSLSYSNVENPTEQADWTELWRPQ